MRLIDADKLVETLDKYDDGIVRGCLCVIKSQPTAYNVDSIIKQLENLSSADADYTLAEDLVDRKSVIDIVRCNKETNN